jgi:hypothetical protein
MGSRRRDSVITYCCARVGRARWLNLSSTRTWPPSAKQLGAPGISAEVGCAGILGYFPVLLRRHANGYLFCHLPGLSAGPFRLPGFSFLFGSSDQTGEARLHLQAARSANRWLVSGITYVINPTSTANV